MSKKIEEIKKLINCKSGYEIDSSGEKCIICSGEGKSSIEVKTYKNNGNCEALSCNGGFELNSDKKCVSCSGTGKTSKEVKAYLDNGRCEANSCKGGYQLSQNKTCIRCSGVGKTTVEVKTYEDNGNCEAKICQSDYIFDAEKKLCKFCDAGYYKGATGNCTQCNVKGQTTTEVKEYKNEGSCDAKTCNNGYKLVNNKCIKCPNDSKISEYETNKCEAKNCTDGSSPITFKSKKVCKCSTDQYEKDYQNDALICQDKGLEGANCGKNGVLTTDWCNIRFNCKSASGNKLGYTHICESKLKDIIGQNCTGDIKKQCEDNGGVCLGGSGKCTDGAEGSPCSGNSDCKDSNKCYNNKCLAEYIEFKGADCWGNDYEGGPRTESVDSCKRKCDEDSKCSTFRFVGQKNTNSSCYLKSFCSALNTNAGGYQFVKKNKGLPYTLVVANEFDSINKKCNNYNNTISLGPCNNDCEYCVDKTSKTQLSINSDPNGICLKKQMTRTNCFELCTNDQSCNYVIMKNPHIQSNKGGSYITEKRSCVLKKECSGSESASPPFNFDSRPDYANYIRSSHSNNHFIIRKFKGCENGVSKLQWVREKDGECVRCNEGYELNSSGTCTKCTGSGIKTYKNNRSGKCSQNTGLSCTNDNDCDNEYKWCHNSDDGALSRLWTSTLASGDIDKGNKSLKECMEEARKVNADYFGLEDSISSRGTSDGKYKSACLIIKNSTSITKIKDQNNKESDSECGPDRLGAGHRMAIYKVKTGNKCKYDTDNYTCEALSCNSGYHLNGTTCSQCQNADKIRSYKNAGSCEAQACNSGYTLSGTGTNKTCT